LQSKAAQANDNYQELLLALDGVFLAATAAHAQATLTETERQTDALAHATAQGKTIFFARVATCSKMTYINTRCDWLR